MFQHQTCAHCGSDFFKIKSWSRFCSRECRRAALNEAAREARRLYRAKQAASGKEAA
jgi:hypothetical protein